MSRKDAAAEHAALVAEIAEHDKRYYQSDAPTISDAEYDKLRLRLLGIEKQYPTLAKAVTFPKGGGGTAGEIQQGQTHCGDAFPWQRLCRRGCA